MPSFFGLLRVALGIIAVGSVSAHAGAQAVDGIARLSWLAGCWSSEKSEAGSGEQWMQPAAGTMIGAARTVKAGKVIDYEFMRIHEGADGRLLFTAIPSGQKEATFAQLRISEAEVVFENATHDFPQRVIYRRTGEASLVARVEGTSKGKMRGIDFPMKRSKCES